MNLMLLGDRHTVAGQFPFFEDLKLLLWCESPALSLVGWN
jgi:hypothetical protein